MFSCVYKCVSVSHKNGCVVHDVGPVVLAFFGASYDLGVWFGQCWEDVIGEPFAWFEDADRAYDGV